MFKKDNYMMFVCILFVRVCMSLLSLTWYVPDETWQSVEVAHNTVFGTGYITWEWWVGIRSSLHPLIFAVPLYILKSTGFDSQYLVVLVPKLTQALITAISEYLLITSVDRKTRSWLATLILFNWHTLYTGSRTLINTVEYCLTCAVLSLHHIWKKEPARSLRYLPLVGLGFMMRPTSALLWAPICIMDLSTYLKWFVCWPSKTECWVLVHRDKVFQAEHIIADLGQYCICLRRREVKHAVTWVLLSLGVVSGCIIIDSIFYNKIIITPANFFMLNVYKNLGVNYGTHAWHWYLSAGLPSLLGPLVLPLLLSLPRANLNMVLPLLVNIICLSILPHKEMRFLQSSLPFIFLILAENISTYRVRYQRLLKTIFLVLNIIGALYFSTIHQRGVVDAASFIGQKGQDLTVKGRDSFILFLMPCHSTPLYSHIHHNMSLRFLECTPNLDEDPSYREEADIFYSNPQLWLQNLDEPHPDILIFFDVLQPRISSYLEDFSTCATFFHTMFPEGRVGGQVIIAARKNLATLTCDNSQSDIFPIFINKLKTLN